MSIRTFICLVLVLGPHSGTQGLLVAQCSGVIGASYMVLGLNPDQPYNALFAVLSPALKEYLLSKISCMSFSLLFKVKYRII